MTTENEERQPLNVEACMRVFQVCGELVSAVKGLLRVMSAEKLVLARIEVVRALGDLTDADDFFTASAMEMVLRAIDRELALRERPPGTVLH